MAENVNMDSFIRDTLRSLQRPRDVDFYSEQKPLIATSTKNFTTTSIPDTPASVSTSGALEGSSDILHPWSVSSSPDSDPDSGEIKWSVVGGTVYTQGSPITVEDTEITGDAGYIILKIVRDSDSREMTDAVVEFAETVPESDYSNQYRVLAYVNSEGMSSEVGTPISQYQFEEIRIFEDLAVVNGAFQLVGLEMSHRNYYELPE
jgi:hypothetical protein